MKKRTKYIIGITSLGAVTGIVTTVALTSIKVMVYYNMDKEAWDGGPSLNDLVKEAERKKESSSSIIDPLKISTAFYLYPEEQKGSIKMQKMDFQYAINKKWKEYKKIKDNDKKKDIKDQIEKINKKIKIIEDGNISEHYSDSDFELEYERILLPIKQIEDKKTKIYKDEKNDFVEKHKTEEEGDKSWMDEMKKRYGGATSEKEAVAYLTYQEIKDKSFGKYQYFLNDQYTLEQKNAKIMNEKGEETKNYIYDFLKDVNTFNLDLKKESKIYFFARKTNNPTNILVDINSQSTDPAIAQIKSSNLKLMSHFLMPIKQDEKNLNGGWTSKKDALIGKKEDEKTRQGILNFYSNKKHYYEMLNELTTEETSKERVNEIWKTLTGTVTDQKTNKKNGFLGLNTQLKLLKDMEPGFSLGLTTGINENVSVSSNPNKLNVVLTKLTEKLNNYFKDNIINNNQDLERVVNSYTDQEITNKIGIKFREAFGRSPELFYKFASKDSIKGNFYGVFSTNGFHIVRIKDFNSQNIQEQINKDAKKATDDQSKDLIQINYNDLFSSVFNKIKIINTLMKNGEDFKNKLKEGYLRTKENKKIGDLPDQLINPENKDSGKAEWSVVLQRIETGLTNNNSIDEIQNFSKIIGTNLKDYILKRYDEEITKATFSRKQIYNDVWKLMDVQEGGK